MSEATNAEVSGPPAAEAPALEPLLALCYGELRTIARRVLRDDGAALQIQPTDLAHEAAIRIMRLEHIVWRDRTHFLATAARVMRQALIDEVRRLKAAKRSAPEITTRWPELAGPRALPLDLFDEALERLFAIDVERARIVELRFYAGLTMPEIAASLDMSLSTAERRWRAARAWLITALEVQD